MSALSELYKEIALCHQCEIAEHRNYSEETAQKIDHEMGKLINQSYGRTKEILGKNIDILHNLAELLLEKETITGDELDTLIRSMTPGTDLPA